MDNENVVAPQDPTPIIPQQQFLNASQQSAGAPIAPKVPLNPGKLPGQKFFGDEGGNYKRFDPRNQY